MTKKLWGGRFSELTSRAVEEFTSSIEVDGRLYSQDIKGSIAWANALKKAKVLTAAEATKIINGLNAILNGLEKGTIKLKDELEDVHMNVESLLTQKIGETGKKLHTGRSRNDQVVTDLKLYLKNEVTEISLHLSALQKVLIKLAEDNIAVIMPGYTHMQQAQPVLLSHHLMAYYEMFARDKGRLMNALERLDVSPLGSGALAGTAYPINRELLAKELGFKDITQNSLDAVSDRDYVAEVLFDISMIMVHLSRFCTELITWSSFEFKFVEIGDAYTTGSSIMPQKKNPDVAELVRGKTGDIFGSLVSILTLTKGLPLAYNRDLQEDKKSLFNSIDTVKASISIFMYMLASTKFNAIAMRKALSSSIIATDLADYLVNKKVPFRTAHEVTGNIVAYCERTGKDIRILSLSEFKKFSEAIENDIYDAITLEKSIDSRNVIGGTSTKQVKSAINKAKKRG